MKPRIHFALNLIVKNRIFIDLFSVKIIDMSSIKIYNICLIIWLLLSTYYLNSCWSSLYFPLSPHTSSARSPISTCKRIGSEEPRITTSKMFMFLPQSSLVFFPEDVLDLLKCLLVSPHSWSGERFELLFGGGVREDS